MLAVCVLTCSWNCYILILELNGVLRVRIRGRTVSLDPGIYVYVGSSRKPCTAITRVARHVSRNKPVKWHIDQVTTSELTRVLGAFLVRSRLEDCESYLTNLMINRGFDFVPEFGSTDKPFEPSHLFKLNCTETALFECVGALYEAAESTEYIEEVVYLEFSPES